MPAKKSRPARVNKRRPAPSPRVKESRSSAPLMGTSEVRRIVLELMTTLAPADVETLMQREPQLRERAAGFDGEKLALLRRQANLALDCLQDHLNGDCPQIPYYTIGLLAAAVCYFADSLDIVPDFLSDIGAFDDGAVMAMAFQLGRKGITRYCDWKGVDANTVIADGSARRRASSAARR